MIVAGLGCRRGCAAADIVALVRALGGADALAAPEWKRDEAGLLAAAQTLGLPLRFVGRAALEAVQARCPTRSAVALQAVGVASVAEAAALASGGRLIQARVALGGATGAMADTDEGGP